MAVVAAGRARGLASFPRVLETNPYQRLLYDALRPFGVAVASGSRLETAWLWHARHEVSVLHFHWPQSFWRHDRGPAALRPLLSYIKLALFVWRLLVARALGYRIVWTIHQVLPHEVASRQLDRLGALALAALCNARIVHDESTAASARAVLGRAAGSTAIVPHGSYVGVYPEGRGRDEVRADLGVPQEAVVFLCFGHLRAYKDLRFLLGAFGEVQRRDAVLVIAGPVGDELIADDVRHAAALDDRIRPRLGYVPDDRVAELFGAADVAVVARNDGGTSASILLGISLGTPVVAARRSAYEALLGDEAAGWLFEPGDRAALAAALEHAAGADPEDRAARAREALRRARALEWPAIAARTAEIMGVARDAAN
jgi:glycosyltransferase involved in cell wall biosynthesis